MKYLKTIIYIAVIVIAALVFTTFVAQRTRVSGSSMKPTLKNRDQLVVEKISYRFSQPERYDVVTFRYNNSKNYIKRIIGLPGEDVQIKEDGYVYVNGEKLDRYNRADDPGIAEATVHLKDNEYFCLGDNRDNSEDSRSEDVGPVKEDQLIGRAVCRFWPLNKWKKL